MSVARISERLVEFRLECLEFHQPPIGLELVAMVAPPPKPIIEIEETRRIHHHTRVRCILIDGTCLGIQCPHNRVPADSAALADHRQLR